MKLSLSTLFALFTMFSFGQNGLHFDGTNDEIQTTYSGVTGSASRTFEAWVYVSSTAPASNLTILDYGSNVSGGRNTFLVAGDRSLRFLSGGTNGNINSAPNTVPLNQWVHVAFVLNSTIANGTGYLYINGVQAVTSSLSSVLTPTTGADVTIGERVSGGSIRFEGIIDEVRIWNKARTQTEIAADMNIEYCIPPANLMAYYKLNEGVAAGTNSTVLTAVDEISGNNGALSGFALTGTTSNWVTGSAITVGPLMAAQSITQCPGTTFTAGANTYSVAGTYNDTLIGLGTNGCDSVIVTTLAFSTIPNDTIVTGICSGDSVSINGVNFFTTSGFYTDTLTNAGTGCDSIVTINLTVNPSVSGSQTISVCDGFALTVGTNVYTVSGIYIDTIPAASGCDSIVTSNLTVLSVLSGSQNVDICDGESFTIGTSVYTTTGMYTDTLAGMASNGCDSIVVTNLTVAAPVNSSASNNSAGFTISANNANATAYQWIDCTTGLAIAGEVGQSFVVTANGSYAVVVTEGNCSDTSACSVYATIGLEDKINNRVSVYPNPSSGKVEVSNITDLFKIYDLKVLNVLGQTVYSKSQLSSDNVELFLEKKGVYFVEVSNGKEHVRQKLIVQ